MSVKKAALIAAIRETNNVTYTDNGDIAYKSTLSDVLDFFVHAGTAERQHRDTTVALFDKAFNEDPELAVRAALWMRDARGGAGRRQAFRDVLQWTAKHKQQDYQMAGTAMLLKASELGRWDDVLSVFDTPLQDTAIDMIKTAIGNGDNLFAKWMPRKGKNARILREALSLNPRGYRKMLVAMTNVVEQKMCANQWSEIDYDKLPSMASARLMNAFKRHDADRYNRYVEAVVKGEATIKANAMYPHDVYKAAKRANDTLATEQWKALPDYVQEDMSFLPIVDVSGSMSTPAGKSITCMDISISLGLYLSERNKSVFKDTMITFSERPELVQVPSGLSLNERFNYVKNLNWDMNTNLDAAMKLIVDAAVKHNVPAEEMPSHLIVLSDMQFDSDWGTNQAASKRTVKMFNDAGYEAPVIIWWDLSSRYNSKPTTAHTKGMMMLSGFSPAMMENVLLDNDATPMSAMLSVLMKDRYNPHVVAQELK